MVLFFGLLRPYKGVECCSTPGGASPMLSCGSSATRGCRSSRCAPGRRPGVRFVPRFVSDAERRRCSAVPTSSCCPTPGPSVSTSPVCSRPRSPSASQACSAISAGSGEVAATGAGELVPGGGSGGVARRAARAARRPGRRAAWPLRRVRRRPGRTRGTRRRADARAVPLAHRMSARRVLVDRRRHNPPP